MENEIPNNKIRLQIRFKTLEERIRVEEPIIHEDTNNAPKLRFKTLAERKQTEKLRRKETVTMTLSERYLFLKNTMKRDNTIVLTPFIDVKFPSNTINMICGKCSNHITTSLYNFATGIGCKYCSGNQKLSIEFIQSKIEEHNDILISTEYKNARTPLEIQCHKCNKIFNMRYDDYKHGKRCGLCSLNRKKTYDEIKTFIESRGDILISEKYIRSSNKLEIQCGRCGKHHLISQSNYKKSTLCYNNPY